MSTLYAITINFQQALVDLQEMLDAGQIDQQTFNDTAEGITGEIREKCINVGHYIKNLQADVDRYKAAEQSFKERRQRAEKAIEWFTSYLETNMQKAELTEIKGEFIDIKFKKLPDIVAITGDVAPEFQRVIPEQREPDKVAIKAALKAGQVLDFATMETGRRKLVVE